MIARFIAAVGLSGVGKDSVMRALADAEPRLCLMRCAITRPADAGGEDDEAATNETFRHRVARGAFAIHWQAHGLFYEIPATLDARLAQGEDVFVNLS